MKNLKILSLVLAVACTSSLFSNENQSRKPFAYVKACLEKCGRQSIDRTVHGDLFIDRGVIQYTYMGSPNLDFTLWEFNGEGWKINRNGKRMNEGCDLGGTVLCVRATPPSCPTDRIGAEKNDPDDSCDWANRDHNHFDKFPRMVPLEFFIDKNGKLKNDGDTVTFFRRNEKTGENIEVVLTLNQRGRDGIGFDDYIKRSREYETAVKPYLGKKSYTNPLSVFHSFVG